MLMLLGEAFGQPYIHKHTLHTLVYSSHITNEPKKRSSYQILNMASNLPPNVHVSTHPCARAKLSQLRSSATNARDTKTLVHEIATIVGCEAFAHGLEAVPGDAVSPCLSPITSQQAAAADAHTPDDHPRLIPSPFREHRA